MTICRRELPSLTFSWTTQAHELQAAKLAGANSEESAQLARENELLRNIVVRERQEEARRDETRNAGAGGAG